MPKSPDAFRTISEVADWLGIQAHVLRFWESKFTQVKPIKRAGGRRYYRPNDMLLLGGIRKLLHDDGLTIKGVQKILREEGMNHVASLSMPLDDMTEPPAPEPIDEPAPMIEEAEPETGIVLHFDGMAEAQDDVKSDPEASETEEEPTELSQEEVAARPDETEEEVTANPETTDPVTEEAPAGAIETADVEAEAEAPEALEPEPTEATPETPQAEEASPEEPLAEDTAANATPADASPDEPGPQSPPIPEMDPEPLRSEEDIAAPEADETAADDMEPMPAFLRHPATPEDGAAEAGEEAQDNLPPEPAAAEGAPEEQSEEPESPAPPRARDIGMPQITPEAEIAAGPGVLTACARLTHLAPDQGAAVRPLLAELAALRDSMRDARQNAPKT